MKQKYLFFWNSLAFSMIQRMLAIWSLVLLPFLNPAWTPGSSWFMNCWIPGLEIFDNLGLLQNWEQKNVLHNYMQIKELVSQWVPYSLSLKPNMIYEVPAQCQTLWGHSAPSPLSHITALQGRSRRIKELTWGTQLLGCCKCNCGFGWWILNHN